MDFSKLTNGQKIAGISGLVLIISIFFDWYEPVFGPFDSVLSAFGVLLVLAAVVILAMKLFGSTDFSLGTLKLEQIALVLAAVGTILILIKVIFGHEEAGIDLGREFGLFLGFFASIGVTAGAFFVMIEAGLDMPDMDDFRSIGGDGE